MRALFNSIKLTFARIALLLLILFFIGQTAEATQKGEVAPDFSLKDLNGEEFRLSNHRGKYLVVNFWATWCVPCKMEMPSLDKLYRRFKSQNFDLFPISNDMFGEKVVRPYVEAQNFSFNVLMDPFLKASNRYSVVTLPTTFLIDPDGKVIGVREGADDWFKPETLKFFEELLKKPNLSLTQGLSTAKN